MVAEHEAALGPVHGRPANADTGGDRLVTGAGIGGEQNLRPLELARRLLATAQKRPEFGALGMAELHPIPYIHPRLLGSKARTNSLNRMAGVKGPPAKTSHAQKQGQYLAFIYAYARLHRRPPTEADMHGSTSASAHLPAHQMILTLERAGFIRRQPRVARSIEMLVDPGKSPGPTLNSPQLVQNLCAAVLAAARGATDAFSRSVRPRIRAAQISYFCEVSRSVISASTSSRYRRRSRTHAIKLPSGPSSPSSRILAKMS